MNKQISRGLKITFLIHAIVGAVMGLAYLMIPTIMGDWVGWNMSDFAYRVVGAAILGFAASSWLAYMAEQWSEVRIVVEAELIWVVLAAVVQLWALLVNAVPIFGWFNFAMLALFGIAFGYFLVVHSRMEQPALRGTH